ncbi:MAG: LLM class flavin-dependent oxidoreductase [Candidatus Dormibacteria bacterium]
MARAVPVSVLDLAPVVAGSTPAEALGNSLGLARHVDALGYHRYWVAEHHNMVGIASSSPAVLIGHLASVTTNLRVGSGGVMLPNHQPLVIAEQFGMLEALHPGRIDLGLGRAPGTDRATARALRRSADSMGADDFLQQLGELVGFFTGSFPEGHPYQRITAVPGLGYAPTLWLLGSSGYSAQVAGALGWPFAFAHHFSPANTVPALQLYRSSFQSGRGLERSHAMVAVSVICADSDQKADWIAGPAGLARVRMATGTHGVYPSPDEAAAHHYSSEEAAIVEGWRASQVVGGPDTVRRRIADLLDVTGADELMVTTTVHDHADRLRSYELLAEILTIGRRVR